MSRQIDLTKPLSDDERTYLEERGLQADLDQNALNMLGGGVDEDAVTVNELKDRLRELGLPVSGNKPELEDRLEAGLAAAVAAKEAADAQATAEAQAQAEADAAAAAAAAEAEAEAQANAQAPQE